MMQVIYFTPASRGEKIFVTPRTWLGSPRNFAKTRFGRFRTFRFSTLQQMFSAKFLDRKFRFSLFWCGFRESTAKRTSKSASSSNFALDGLIQRSVRPKNLGFGIFVVLAIFFHWMPARVPNTFSVRDLFPQPHIIILII